MLDIFVSDSTLHWLPKERSVIGTLLVLTCSCGTSWWRCWSSGSAGRPALRWFWGRGRASAGRLSSEPPSPRGPAPPEASSAAAVRGSGSPGCNLAPPGWRPQNGCRSRSSVAASCKLQTQGKAELQTVTKSTQRWGSASYSASIGSSIPASSWLQLFYLIFLFEKLVYILLFLNKVKWEGCRFDSQSTFFLHVSSVCVSGFISYSSCVSIIVFCKKNEKGISTELCKVQK